MRRVEKVRRVACPDCEAPAGARCTQRGQAREANHQARIRAHGKAFPPIERGQRPAGSLAWFDGTCARCPHPIQRHVHQVVRRREDWIHTTCASGQDDV